jgi:HK97 gp10 family phage protein
MASELEGVAELTAQLLSLGVAVATRNLKATVKEAMQEVEHGARSRIPIGTVAHLTYRGRLVSPGYAAATLHIETGLSKVDGAAYALLGVGREAFYAVQFDELGTSKMQAQPWLRPAFAEAKDPALRKLADSLRKRVERAVKRQAAAGGE